MLLWTLNDQQENIFFNINSGSALHDSSQAFNYLSVCVFVSVCFSGKRLAAISREMALALPAYP